MKHARIPDFSHPAPVRVRITNSDKSARIPVDRRYRNLPDEPIPGEIEPWEAVTPIRPDTAHTAAACASSTPQASCWPPSPSSAGAWCSPASPPCSDPARTPSGPDARAPQSLEVSAMSLRTTLKSLIRRDPAASLRERATELRDGLNRQTMAADAAAHPQLERAEYRARLLTAYAEDRQARPMAYRLTGWTLEHEACGLVYARCWDIAREIIALPPSMTPEGMGLTALASAILIEADFRENDPTITAAVGLTRAVLAATGTPLPPGFVGFGDEPDHEERDNALHTASNGRLPEWAIAQAEAKLDAEDAQDDADAAEAEPSRPRAAPPLGRRHRSISPPTPSTSQ